MTVKEIETLIPVALERFKQRIPQFVEWIDNVPIRVATRHTGEKLFRSTIKSLKAWEKEGQRNITLRLEHSGLEHYKVARSHTFLKA